MERHGRIQQSGALKDVAQKTTRTEKTAESQAASGRRDDAGELGGSGFLLIAGRSGGAVRRNRYAAATSAIVLYGLASFNAISSLISGQAGSISVARKLNFGLRG